MENTPYFRWLVYASLALFLSSTALSAQSPIFVRIQSGLLEGIQEDDNLLMFKGIPFAEPPMKELRWRPPQDVKPWEGTRKATRFQSDCMQKPVAQDSAPSGTTPSEDCLYLNVWAPPIDLRCQSARCPNLKPVLVWIHGGAYVNGGSSASLYDGQSFARQGIVVVSLNYRLGRFGFFAHPALRKAYPGETSNFGIADQIKALEWVRKNIHSFGGDFSNVTIAGQSAGGDSVLFFLTNAEYRHLFSKAIVLSGGGRNILLGGRKMNEGTTTEPSALDAGLNFAHLQRINGDSPEALESLKALPAQTIRGRLNFIDLLLNPDAKLLYAGGPIIDGILVKQHPQDVFKARQAAPAPLMIGSTDGDIGWIVTQSKNALFEKFGARENEARAIYDPNGDRTLQDLSFQIGGDLIMQEPAIFVAQQMTAAGNSAWRYRFAYIPDSLKNIWTTVPHSADLPFFFNTLPARFQNGISDRDLQMAERTHLSFAQFVKTGDPTTSRVNWPATVAEGSNLFIFSNDRGAQAVDEDPWIKRLDLMRSLWP